MKGHGADHKRIAEALRRAAKAHEDAAKHMKKQGYKDREHESEGMKAKMDRSAAQKKALKGKSAKKKREIIGGEKANIRLRQKRKEK